VKSLIVLGASLTNWNDGFGKGATDLPVHGWVVKLSWIPTLDEEDYCRTISCDAPKVRPDILLLIADCYEMRPRRGGGGARIPIAHIEGGEISEGAIDDAVRNALTKMAHLHFTSTFAAKDRVIAMGEEPWRVTRAGAPSLDHLRRSKLLERGELEAKLEMQLQEHATVIAYHPVTLAQDTLQEAEELFAALGTIEGQMLFCYPNADAGSRELIELTKTFVKQRGNGEVFVNLDALTYWSLLREAQIFLGNSSSGIMETPSFALPAINIGERQRGRERAANIIDATANRDEIIAAVKRARSQPFRESLAGMNNPYGEGAASEKILEVLTKAPLGEKLLIKRAMPIAVQSAVRTT
jgi:UDP-N-acetylglucosamine 2-epimerase (non-hydrolysing)/GDP/UDP-N,N'-diacetylbacillosamine 2-epimerase (hydrolysing)